MKTALLLIPILILMSAPLSGNEVRAQRLLPYHFNPVTVDNDGSLDRVEIHGTDYQDRDHLLFRSRIETHQKQISCVVYLDQELYAVRIELIRHSGESQQVELEIENNPYRVGVYVPAGYTLQLVDPYYPVPTPGGLEPGDVSLWAGDPTLLNRGIHLISGNGEKGEPVFPAWRGADLSGPAPAGETLDLYQDRLTTIKEQYIRRFAAAPFHGVRLETHDLNFSDTPRIGDIAETLLQRLPPRFSGRFVYALAAFTLLSILCLLFLHRRFLYIGIIVLVIAFALAVVSGRDPDTKFTLTLNPDRWQDSSTWRQTNTGGATLAGQAIDRAALDGVNQTFEPVDFSKNRLRMRLEVFRSYTKSLPLSAFSDARLVKFNQYPLLRPEGSGYSLSFENPLKVWTLHDPE